MSRVTVHASETKGLLHSFLDALLCLPFPSGDDGAGPSRISCHRFWTEEERM